jgi:hypothetical protein
LLGAVALFVAASNASDSIPVFVLLTVVGLVVWVATREIRIKRGKL